MLFADIVLVVGTRPEAIKLAPVAQALAARGLPFSLLLTGQHPDLDPGNFDFGGCDVVELGCRGRADPDAHVDAVAAALTGLLPGGAELIVVQGDTSSASGAARAAVSAGVALAHVEAGLRTHDRRSPWPEEDYRVAIDAYADLLFAPTAISAANLAAEKARGTVVVTGNSGVDSTVRIAERLPAPSLRDSAVTRLLVTCHRRESWGDGLTSIASALVTIAREERAEIDFLLHPNRHVASLMRALLGFQFGINLLPPCGHAEMLGRMRDADLVLSDSGGIQEEAPVLGVPLLVLREKTERPEGIASGNSRLVGTDTARIVAQVRALIRDPIALAAMGRRAMPYGDGRASGRIADTIGQWLAACHTRPARISSGRRWP